MDYTYQGLIAELPPSDANGKIIGDEVIIYLHDDMKAEFAENYLRYLARKRPRVSAEITGFHDGDTFYAIVNGVSESIRLIGIDTDEVENPHEGTPAEKWGIEAASALKERLNPYYINKKPVQLEFDMDERDVNGRLLAYVWLPDTQGPNGPKMLNAIMLEGGHGECMTIGANYTYSEWFARLQNFASSKSAGRWGKGYYDPEYIEPTRISGFHVSIPKKGWSNSFEYNESTGKLTYKSNGDTSVKVGDQVVAKIDVLDESIAPKVTLSNSSERIKPVTEIGKVTPLPAVNHTAPPYPEVHEMRLGISKFVIPPLSIDVQRVATVEKVGALRTAGTIKRGTGHHDVRIVLSLFYNSIDDINDPVNGIRPLLAQFKRSPFLPIDSYYLNMVHNIWNVTLVNMAVTTVPGFPDSLKVTLTLSKFNHFPFMPSILSLGQAINYDMFKWYIQKDYIYEYNTSTMMPKKNGNVDIDGDPYKCGLFTKIPYERESAGFNSISFSYAPTEFLEQAKKVNALYPNSEIIDKIKESAPIYKTAYNDRETVRMLDDIRRRIPTSGFKDVNEKMIIVRNYAAKYPMPAAWYTKLPTYMQDFLQTLDSAASKTGLVDLFVSGDPKTKVLPVTLNPTDIMPMSVNNDSKVLVQNVVIREKEFVELLKGEAIAAGIAENDSRMPKLNNVGFSVILDNNDPVFRAMLDYSDTRFKSADSNFKMALNKHINSKNGMDESSIPLLPYDIEDADSLIVTSIQASYDNMVTSLQVEQMDSPTHQYLGSQDIYIKVDFECLSETALKSLRELFDYTQKIARDYRSVVTTGFLKVHNDLINMMGVKHIVIESLDVYTTPGFPGRYKVEMILIDFNVMQSKMERSGAIIGRLDEGGRFVESGDNYSSSAYEIKGDALIKKGANSGIRTQFHIEELMSNFNLYPDLNLPTYRELFNASANSKLFLPIAPESNYDWDARVDPDFYYYRSVMLKDRIVDKLDHPENTLMTLVDQANGRYETNVVTAPAYTQMKDAERGYFKEVKGYKPVSTSAFDKRDSDYHENMVAAIATGNVPSAATSSANKKSAEPLFTDAAATFPATNPSPGEIYRTILQKMVVHNVRQVGFADEYKKATGVSLYSKIPKTLPILLVKKMSDGGTVKQFITNKDGSLGIYRRGRGAGVFAITPEWLEFINHRVYTDKDGMVGYNVSYDNIAKNMELNVITGLEIMTAKFLRGFGSGSNEAEKQVNFVKDVVLRYASDQMTKLTTEREAMVKAAADYDLHIKSAENMIEWYKDTWIQTQTKDKIDAGENQTQINKKLGDYQNAKVNNPNAPKPDLSANTTPKLENKPNPYQGQIDALQTQVIDPGKTEAKKLRAGADERLQSIEKYQKIIDDCNEVIKNGGFTSSIQNGNAAYDFAWIWVAREMLAESVGIDPLAKPEEGGIDIVGLWQEYNNINMTLTGSDSYDNDDIKTYWHKDLEMKPSMDKSIEKFIDNRFANAQIYTAFVPYARFKEETEMASAMSAVFSETSDINPAMFPDYGSMGSTDVEEAMAGMFYDAIKYDFRGRMVRAFPTFHMFIIEEGRTLKRWKLWDNFYGFSAISSIDIVKSRKIVADTVIIQLSNIFGGVANEETMTDNEDAEKNKLNFLEWFATGVMPDPRFSNDQKEKMDTAKPGLILKEGSRLHLRVGYGSNAKNLPVVFNGTVTEFEVGDVVQIVAQGDGIELSNKLPVGPGRTTGYMGMGSEPRNIICSLLTTHGFWNDALQKLTGGVYGWGTQSYGVQHFGDFNYKYPLRKEAGEVGQNIHPGIFGASQWIGVGDSGTVEKQPITINPFFWVNKLTGNKDDGMNELNLSIDMYDKTVWDIVNTCALAVPNYIAAVHPFGFRSTLFYGKPHFGLAYDYDYCTEEEHKSKPDANLWSGVPGQSDTKNIMYFRERRKPFQQWHVLSSYFDIMANKMKASSIGVYNNVIGKYYAEPGSWLGNILDVAASRPHEALVVAHADRDILPQYQKTITVDTGIRCGGNFILGNIPVISKIWGWAHNFHSTQTAALAVTQSVLRDYMKDMYQGQITIIGDPSIKPYDGIYLWDYYNEIFGVCEVEQVTHHMDAESGFITTITPDAAVSVADPERYKLWSWVGSIGAAAASETALITFNSAAAAAKIAMMSSTISGAVTSVGTALAPYFANVTAEYATAKAAENVVSSIVGDIVKSAKSVWNWARGIKGLAPAAEGLASVGSGALSILGVAAVAFLAHSAEIAVRRYFQLSQCLTVAPLLYKSKPFTAAMTGSKGLVVGTVNRLSSSEAVNSVISSGLSTLAAPVFGGSGSIAPNVNISNDVYLMYHGTYMAKEEAEKIYGSNSVMSSLNAMSAGPVTSSTEELAVPAMGKLNPRVDDTFKNAYAPATASTTIMDESAKKFLAEAVQKHGIPAAAVFVPRIIWTDSSWNPAKIGEEGRFGLTQIHPRQAQVAASGMDISVNAMKSDIRLQIFATVFLLKKYYTDFGTWPRAIAAFKFGPEVIEKNQGTFPKDKNTTDYIHLIFGDWE